MATTTTMTCTSPRVAPAAQALVLQGVCGLADAEVRLVLQPGRQHSSNQGGKQSRGITACLGGWEQHASHMIHRPSYRVAGAALQGIVHATRLM
jgi:hypothetical protein